MMMYQIAAGRTLEDINSEVDMLLLKGWKPLGGISVVYTKEYDKEFYQAMIFEVPD
jgi:Domain of unknown function (DUF1737)